MFGVFRSVSHFERKTRRRRTPGTYSVDWREKTKVKDRSQFASLSFLLLLLLRSASRLSISVITVCFPFDIVHVTVTSFLFFKSKKKRVADGNGHSSRRGRRERTDGIRCRTILIDMLIDRRANEHSFSSHCKQIDFSLDMPSVVVYLQRGNEACPSPVKRALHWFDRTGE